MTGSDVAKIRAELRLSLTQFAQLLGVGRSTVCRWESMPDTESVQHQLRVLELVRAHLASSGPRQIQRLGDDIVDALALGGGLAGLYALLSHCLDEGVTRLR